MTQTLDERSRVTVSPSVHARPFGEELVILEFGLGEYFGLDPIGTAVWRRLAAGDDLGAVADHLVSEFEVDREQALRDVMTLVGELRDKGLLASP
jgi:hypothetical protein